MKRTPNPAGREGKPITLGGYSFDEAIERALTTPPPPREPKPPKRRKKPTKTRRKA